jgi:hypothetical protein
MLIRLAFNDALTYDALTNTSGANGSIRYLSSGFVSRGTFVTSAFQSDVLGQPSVYEEGFRAHNLGGNASSSGECSVKTRSLLCKFDAG